MVFVICLLIGLMTAFIGSLMGLGGGIILIPSLLFMSGHSEAFAWATPQAIVGVSLITMIFTALSSTIAYSKKGRVDYKTGLLFLAGSIPGGVLGSLVNQYINADDFLLYFGFLMLMISMLFFMKRKSSSAKILTGKSKHVRTFYLEGKTYQYTVSVWAAFILSLGVGTLSGLFGIGGGSIMVPAMILLFGFPAHIATATSMFMILFISITSAGTHMMLGHIAWEYVFAFIPGAWIGAKLGVKINQVLPGKILEWILRALLIVISIRMIIQGLS